MNALRSCPGLFECRSRSMRSRRRSPQRVGRFSARLLVACLPQRRTMLLPVSHRTAQLEMSEGSCCCVGSNVLARTTPKTMAGEQCGGISAMLSRSSVSSAMWTPSCIVAPRLARQLDSCRWHSASAPAFSNSTASGRPAQKRSGRSSCSSSSRRCICGRCRRCRAVSGPRRSSIAFAYRALAAALAASSSSGDLPRSSGRSMINVSAAAPFARPRWPRCSPKGAC